MRREHYSRVTQYALILCLALALLFAQAARLHLHIEHDETVSSASAGHIVDVHVASSLHEAKHEVSHHNAIDVDIDSTNGSLVKKVGSVNPLVFLLLVISLVLCVPPLLYFRLWFEQTKSRTPPYYFPLLRAPPVA